MRISINHYDLTDEYPDGARYFRLGGYVASHDGIRVTDWLQKNCKQVDMDIRKITDDLFIGGYFTTNPYITEIGGYTEEGVEKVREQMNGEFKIRGHFHDAIVNKYYLVQPKRIWFNGLATTCLFHDGEKVTVKAIRKEEYDKEVGVAMCIAKKMYGTRGEWLKAVNSGNDQNPIIPRDYSNVRGRNELE